MKRPATKPILVGVGAVAVLSLAAWALFRGGSSGPQAATAKPPDSKAQAPAPPPATLLASNEPGKPAGQPEPGPVEIHQGKQPASNASFLGHTPGAGPAEALDPKGSVANPSAPLPSGGSTSVATTPTAPPPSAPATVPSSASPAAQALISPATAKLESGDPVGARVLFSRALADSRLTESDRQLVRDELSTINDDLVFSPRVAKDDPFVTAYAVQSGDSLIRIARKLATGPDYRLIARVNGMKDIGSLHEGQKLKVLKGPFHAIVNKSAYRLDVYMGPSDKQEDWVYVRSFRVGLGESNGTPIGMFTVKKGSKLIDPPWINPHTGEKFPGGDPKNPIGHRWVGLEGQGDTAKFTGYGIHGTIDPGSIGQQKSMGCIRMGDEDIQLVFELMGEQVSVVKIVP
jgi:hypothetical protein